MALTVLFLFNIQEIPKTPDFAPSRTFYLYTCNQLPTARMLLQNCYKVKHAPPIRALANWGLNPSDLPFANVCPLVIVCLMQTVANLIVRRLFESKESKWVLQFPSNSRIFLAFILTDCFSAWRTGAFWRNPRGSRPSLHPCRPAAPSRSSWRRWRRWLPLLSGSSWIPYAFT